MVANGASSGPHARAPASSHPRNGGWHPHGLHQQQHQPQQQQQQQQQQFAAGNKEYSYRQYSPRYHNGYINELAQLLRLS